MAAPLVVKSTDPGVPIITGVNGCIIEVLDTYLLPLGWIKLFEGLNKAVYQPPNAIGNKLLYQIYDGANACNGSTAGYYVRSFESMSDVDTGSGMSPPSGQYTVRTKAIHGITTPRPWVLIADGYGFWLGIEAYPYAGQTQMHMQYTGEAIPIWDDDMWFSIVHGYTSGSTDPNTRPPEWPIFNSGIAGCVARPLSGDATKIGIAQRCVAASVDQSRIGSTDNPAYRAYPWKGQLVYSRPIIKDGVSSDNRGYLPGLYDPHHGSGFTRYQIIPDGAKQLMAIDYLSGNNYPGWMLIDISEGFRQ